jgi:hypothetical protein
VSACFSVCHRYFSGLGASTPIYRYIGHSAPIAYIGDPPATSELHGVEMLMKILNTIRLISFPTRAKILARLIKRVLPPFLFFLLHNHGSVFWHRN